MYEGSRPKTDCVGRKIRHKRWQNGMTQLELANRLGISFQEVQLMEANVREVSEAFLERIAAVQDTPLKYYLDK